MTSTSMLSTSDAYLVAQDRGFDGSKEQLRMMARETPKILEAEYGLAYSSTPEFSRNAKNWQDMRPDEPRPVNLSEKNGKKGKRAAANNAPKNSGKLTLLPNASSSSSSNPSTMTDIQNIAELAQVLTWFTREVDQLRQRLNSLQSNGAVASDSSAVSQLRSENESLRAENAALKDKVNHVQQALGIVDEEPTQVAVASPPAPKPSAAPSPAPKTSKKQSKRGRKPTRGRKPSSSKAPSSSEVDPNVNLALEAIFDYNNQAGLSKEDKWAVSYPVMKDLLKQVGAATQPKIKQVFDARRKEIDRHHQSHGLSSRHNRVHGDRSISDFIQLKGK